MPQPECSPGRFLPVRTQSRAPRAGACRPPATRLGPASRCVPIGAARRTSCERRGTIPAAIEHQRHVNGDHRLSLAPSDRLALRASADGDGRAFAELLRAARGHDLQLPVQANSRTGRRRRTSPRGLSSGASLRRRKRSSSSKASSCPGSTGSRPTCSATRRAPGGIAASSRSWADSEAAMSAPTSPTAPKPRRTCVRSWSGWRG